MLRYALLGFMNYSPSTGYDLKQIMDLSTSNFWHAKQSQIYTALKKMQSEGLVVSQIEPQEGRPDRRVYSITGAGREALLAWLTEPLTELEPRKESLLLKLFFAAPIGKDALLTQLRLQRELHQKQLALYQGETRAVIQQFASQMPGSEEHALLWEATRRFGELYEETYLSWLDETTKMVEDKF